MSSELALLTHSKMEKKSPGLVHLLFNRRIKFLSLYCFLKDAQREVEEMK